MGKLARVKPGLSHAQYSGGDVFEASADEWAAFGDKFEEVRPDEGAPPPPPIVVTDSAMQLADELGVDLYEVEGTGQDGRIIVSDVRAFAAARAAEE